MTCIVMWKVSLSETIDSTGIHWIVIELAMLTLFALLRKAAVKVGLLKEMEFDNYVVLEEMLEST